MHVLGTARRVQSRELRAAAVVLAVTASVLAPTTTTSAGAQSDPSSPTDKGRPGTLAPAAPAAPACDLTLGDGPKDEFANCTQLVLSAQSTPDVGATSTIDVAVTSVADLRDATLTVAVNDGFALTGADGFADAAEQPSGVGTLTAVARTVDVSAGVTTHFSVDVTGVKGGLGVVKATLDAHRTGFDGGDELDVRLGQQAAVPPRGAATVKAPAGAELAPRTKGTAPYRPARVKGATSLSPGAPGASCATGRWVYNDEHGLQNPSVNFQVKVWDQDPGGTDDVLAVGVTGFDGSYHLCFESTDGDGGGGQEVYVQFVSEIAQWRVRNTSASNQTYVWGTGAIGIGDPGTADFGTLQPGAPADHRALHAYDGLNKLWLWHGQNYLDNPGESRQMVLNWTSTSTDGTYYSTGPTKDIHLAAADPDALSVTIHEGAHALMDALYDDDWPPNPNCSPHSIFGVSSTGCAWTEGWAEWVPARVLNDPFFRWPTGESLDLENQGWNTFTGARGDAAEGRIAGALIDLSDSNNEGPWDRYTEGGSTGASEEILQTMLLKQVSDTLSEYFNVDRAGEGDTGYLARAAVFQNSIDYTHRDPLTSTEELVRPALDQVPNPHRYSYTASNAYWGGVAIRPADGVDDDLSLYSDEAQATLLAGSAAGGSTIDYVVVDGNHRQGTFFPRATYWSGPTAPYTIEEVTGSQTMGLGTASLSFGAGDIIQPLDASVAAGVTQYVRVVPAGALDVELFAHVSDEVAGTTTQARGNAVAVSSSGGAGVAEAIQYSAPTDDWTGLVVLDKAGSGGYTIYRDNAAPTGTVQVDGGNAQTYDTSVDLTLAAVEAHTPVTEMQVSTDGTFDAEPWVSYATTATATLPSGNGTKTVSVRYRSAAGAVSSTVTDDINLVSVPTCQGQTATVFGNGTVTGTSGPDVIVGGPGADSISGLGGNDVICGLGGNDSVNDGPGADQVHGDNGNDVFNQPATVDNGDVFDGGDGTDQVSYGGRTVDLSVSIDAAANDGAAGEGDLVQTTVENVTTGSGNDTIAGSTAANRLIGNGGNDTLNGVDGNDYLAGVGGDDTLRGATGTDTVLGGDGDDIVDEGTGANGTDVVKGGTGFDRITYASRSAAVAIRLNGVATSGAAGENDKLIGFEYAVGGSAADTIVGHTTADRLHGNGGDDAITGNGGNDILLGGAGADTLAGGNGNDSIDSVDGVSGNDTANGGAGTDSATTDPGDVRISIP